MIVQTIISQTCDPKLLQLFFNGNDRQLNILTAKASIPEYIYIYISQQSILKQGFQKTHFPMVLEVEKMFAVDLANF